MSTVDHLQIPVEVADALAYYVYLLRDPRDGEVFYVGKGVGQRIFAHVNLAIVGKHDPDLAPAKVQRIHAILESGQQVEHLFVRTEISDEATAYIVEQSVIDALMAAGMSLTNAVLGHHSASYGLATVTDMVALHAAEPAPPFPPGSVVFIINRAWRKGESQAAVFDATRGHWRIGKTSRLHATKAFGVARGVIRGAYTIDDWYPDPLQTGRWGFYGKPAADLQNFVGTHVREVLRDSGPGSQNPVRLFL